MDKLEAFYAEAERRGWEVGYGFWLGGDPREFLPDRENTPEEVARWEADCAAWERGECPEIPPAGRMVAPGVHVLFSVYGPGTYRYPPEHEGDPDDNEALYVKTWGLS